MNIIVKETREKEREREREIAKNISSDKTRI
jgi:hypothetical protein